MTAVLREPSCYGYFKQQEKGHPFMANTVPDHCHRCASIRRDILGARTG